MRLSSHHIEVLSVMHPKTGANPNWTQATRGKSEPCWSWRKKPSAVAAHSATAHLTLTKPGSKLFLRTTIVQVGCRFLAGFRHRHFTGAFWMKYLSFFNSQSWRKLGPKSRKKLMQSSKRHWSWYALGTCLRLRGGSASFPDVEALVNMPKHLLAMPNLHINWFFNGRFLGTSTCRILSQMYQDVWLDPSWPWYPKKSWWETVPLFISFHFCSIYFLGRSLRMCLKFSWQTGSRQKTVLFIKYLTLLTCPCHRRGILGCIWLQPVDACTSCGMCHGVDLRKKLGITIKHIIGENHEPLSLGQKLFDPSADGETVYSGNIGKQFCWAWVRVA